MSIPGNIFLWTSQWFTQQGLPYEALSLTESTNDLAKKNAFNDPAFFIYLADQQSQGRGRGDNTWTTPSPGSALLVSFSYDLLFPPQHLAAPLVGLQLYRAATATWPELKWSLKAPNDLYVDNKKVAGLLVESVSRGDSQRFIIGLGLNVFASPIGIDTASHLQNFIPQINNEIWNAFLTRLNFNLSKSTDLVGLTQLPPTLCEDLFQALKAHPAAGQLKSLSINGDLVYPDRTVGWHEL